MPARLSHRSRCRTLAAQVVKHLVEASEAETVELALARTIAAIERDQAFQLAHDPDANLIDEIHRERVRRFVARGCRQIGPDAWRLETREIAQAVEDRLAERFRRQSKNWAKNDFSPNAPCQG